jgi:hypothetical protein
MGIFRIIPVNRNGRAMTEHAVEGTIYEVAETRIIDPEDIQRLARLAPGQAAYLDYVDIKRIA